ncbi:hypothetical protein ASA1KI_26130 [Opitutales bacterium ASA1]|uniref:LPS assembly lipoprotein LptE n=1 Tax=Congregicoccus parvus TaxID=3081749 RepID=UPI002B2AC3AF|nr:hypothetical protein ASA1KI_26130 [Opitutales bacterium ASA1]
MPLFLRTFVVLLGASVLLGGCIGYRFGSAPKPPFRSVHVAAPVNASFAPQSVALLGTVVRREIDRSADFRVADERRADAVLTITLRDLRRELSADRAGDTGLARKWRVTLTADCTLVDRNGGRTFFENRPVSAFDEIYTDSGQTTTEAQNMPVLMTRLGEAIARELASGW